MRTNNGLGLVLATTAALMLSGCVIAVNDGDGDFDWSSSERENRSQLEKLTVGMSTETVLALMGTADFNELYQEDGQAVQVLYFRTHHRHSDGDTTKDECTPVVFKDGKVSGWGDIALQSSVKI
ncbi:DUF3192 domain-containing protein [Ferrimonas lipolytica]|uniref:DUF3192 domain-containing protein n=1 Tax=Ferrimonas lipolytica TaxID=2724191 RepID=A0A6H1UED1_9GAMM|nr:DUF3192 domain-containing protein [Ferrimonas lipolytica]QIZ77404.1 DUF3192 domain-containing protein [Ferrimonas lipolytica]